MPDTTDTTDLHAEYATRRENSRRAVKMLADAVLRKREAFTAFCDALEGDLGDQLPEGVMADLRAQCDDAGDDTAVALKAVEQQADVMERIVNQCLRIQISATKDLREALELRKAQPAREAVPASRTDWREVLLAVILGLVMGFVLGCVVMAR